MTTAAIPSVLLSPGSEIGHQHQDKATSVLSLGRYQILRRRSRTLLSDGDVFLSSPSNRHSHSNWSRCEGDATLATPETDDFTVPLPANISSTNIQGHRYQSDSRSSQLDNFNIAQKTPTSLLLETHPQALSNQEPNQSQMSLPVTSSVNREHVNIINKEPFSSWKLQSREEENSELLKITVKNSERDDRLPETSPRFAYPQVAKTRSVSLQMSQPSFHSQDIKKKKDRKISDVTWKPSLEKAQHGEPHDVLSDTSGKKHKSKFLSELYHGAEKIKNFISRGKRKESKSSEEKAAGAASGRKKSSASPSSKTKDSPDSSTIALSRSDSAIPSNSNKATRGSHHSKQEILPSSLCTLAKDEATSEESDTKIANSVFVSQESTDNHLGAFGIKSNTSTTNQGLLKGEEAALERDLLGAKVKRAGTDFLSSAPTEEDSTDVFLTQANSQNVGYIDDVFTPEISTCSTNSTTDRQGKALFSGQLFQAPPAPVLEPDSVQQTRQDLPRRHQTSSTLLNDQQPSSGRPASRGHVPREGTGTAPVLSPQVSASNNTSETLDNTTSRPSPTQVGTPGLGQMRWRPAIHHVQSVEADKKTENLYKTQSPAVCASESLEDLEELLQSAEPVERHQIRSQIRTSRQRPQSERVPRTSLTELESPNLFQPKHTLTASSRGFQTEKEHTQYPRPPSKTLREHHYADLTNQQRKYQNPTTSVRDSATNMQLHEVKHEVNKDTPKNAVENGSNITFVSKVLEEAKAKIRLRSQSLTSESRMPRSFRSTLESHTNHKPTSPNHSNHNPAGETATEEHMFVSDISFQDRSASQSGILSPDNLDSPSSRYREARRQILKSANVFPTSEDTKHHTVDVDSLKYTQYKESISSSQISLGNLQPNRQSSFDSKENKNVDVFTKHQTTSATIPPNKDDINIDDTNNDRLHARHSQKSKNISELKSIPGSSTEKITHLNDIEASFISENKLEWTEDKVKTMKFYSTNNLNLPVQRSNAQLTDFEKLEKGLKPSNSKIIVSSLAAKFTDKAKENISQVSTSLRRTQSLHSKPDKKSDETDQSYLNCQGWSGAQIDKSKHIDAQGAFNISKGTAALVSSTQKDGNIHVSQSLLKEQKLGDQGISSRQNIDLKSPTRLDRRRQVSRSLTEQDRDRSGIYTSQLLVSFTTFPEKTFDSRTAGAINQSTDVQSVLASNQTPKPKSVPNVNRIIGENLTLMSENLTSESKLIVNVDTSKASSSDLNVKTSPDSVQIPQNLLNLLPCSVPADGILEPDQKAPQFFKPSDSGIKHLNAGIQLATDLKLSGSEKSDPTCQNDESSLKVTSQTQGDNSALTQQISEFLGSRAPMSNSPEKHPDYHGDDVNLISFSQNATIQTTNPLLGIQSTDDSKTASSSTVPTWRQNDACVDRPVTAMEKAFSLLLEELDKIGSSEGNPSDLELSDNEDFLFSSRSSRDLIKITDKQRSNPNLTLSDEDLEDGKGNAELSANEQLLESERELKSALEHQVQLGQLDSTSVCPREAEVPEVSSSGGRILDKNRGTRVFTDLETHTITQNLETHAVTDNSKPDTITDCHEAHTSTDLGSERRSDTDASTEMSRNYFSPDKNDETRQEPPSLHAPFPSTIDSISQSNQPEVGNTAANSLSSNHSTNKPTLDNTAEKPVLEYCIDNTVLDNATDNLVLNNQNNQNNNPVPDFAANNPDSPAEDIPVMEVDMSDGHLLTHKPFLSQPPFNLNERARNSPNFLTTCSFDVSEDLDGAITVQAVTGDQHQNKVVTVRTKTQRTPSDANEQLRDTIVEKKTLTPGGTLVLERDVTHSKTRLTSRGSNYYTRSKLSSRTRWPQEGGQSVEHNVCVQNENRSVSKGQAWGDTATARVLLEDAGESRVWSSGGSLEESPEEPAERKMGSHGRDREELEDQGGLEESGSMLENIEQSASDPPLDVPKFQKLLSDQTVTEGQTTSLVCQVNEATSVRWHKDGVVQKNSPDLRQTFDGRLARLEIEELVLADGGQYACVASNCCGEATTSCWLTVTANEQISQLAPIFLNKFQNQALDEEETLTLECDVIGCPRPCLLWFKDGQELRQSSRFRYVYDGRVATLQVSPLTLGDSGSYTCVAQNEVGRVSADVSITVHEKRSAPEFTSTLRDVRVDAHGNIVLQCHVSGRPLPAVSWKKDGQLLLPTSRILQSFRGGLARLDVLSADVQDTGYYECVAGNSVLAVSCRCQVDVIRPIAVCETPAPNSQQIQTAGPRVTRRIFKKLSEPRPADIIAAVIQRASAHTLQRAHSFSAPNSTVDSPCAVVPVAAPFRDTVSPSRDIPSTSIDTLSSSIRLTSTNGVSTSGDIPSTPRNTASPSRNLQSTTRDTLAPSSEILSVSRDTVARSRNILLTSRNIVTPIIENVTSNKDTVTEVRGGLSFTKDPVVSSREYMASVNDATSCPLDVLSVSKETHFQEDKSSPQSNIDGINSSIPAHPTHVPLYSASSQATPNTGDPPPVSRPTQSFISRTPSLKLVHSDSNSVSPKPWDSNLSRSVSMKILRSSDMPSKPEAVKSLSSGNSSYQTSPATQIQESVAGKAVARKAISSNLERSVSMKNILRNLNVPARAESVSSLAQNNSPKFSTSRVQELASETSFHQPFTSGLERSVSMNIFRSKDEPSKIETSWVSTNDVTSQFPPPGNVQEPRFDPSYKSRQLLSSNLGRSASLKILRSQDSSLHAGSVDSLHAVRSPLSFSPSQGFDTQDNANTPGVSQDYKRDTPIPGYRSMSLRLTNSSEPEKSPSIQHRSAVNKTSQNNHVSDTTTNAEAHFDQVDNQSSAIFQSASLVTSPTLPAKSYDPRLASEPKMASSNLSSSSQGSITLTSSSASEYSLPCETPPENGARRPGTGNFLDGESLVQPEVRPVPTPRQRPSINGVLPGVSSPESQSRLNIINAVKRVQSLPLHSVRPLVVQRTSGPASHWPTNMPSYDTITDEEELHKLMNATEDFDERKKIRARLREIRDKQREENEARRRQREAEAEDLVKQKFQRAEEEKKKKMEAYKQQAPTHERDSKYHQVSQSLIQDKFKTAEEEKAKKMAAYASIASKSTGENTTTKIEDTPGGGTRYVVQKTTESKGFGGTSYGKPAEVTAQELTERLMRSSGPGVRGHVTVRTEKWNSTDGLIEKSEKSHSWGAKPQGAKSAMAAFKQMDTTNNPGSSLAKPKGMVRSPSAIKDILLNWAKSMTQGYSGVEVTNFSTSWNDGMAFCALIHHFFPQAFDFSKLDPKQRRYNFTLAFDTAEKEADIAPLLDVEDMVKMKNPDWKCVFTYVQSIYRHLKDHENNKAGPVEQ